MTVRRLLLGLLLLVVGGSLALWVWWHPIEHWFAHGTGSYNTPGSPHNYNFNSGAGSIWIPVFATPAITLTGLAAGFWWHHQCHVDGCLRYARRVTAAGDRACWVHHPDRVPLTERLLHARHHEVKKATGKVRDG